MPSAHSPVYLPVAAGLRDEEMQAQLERMAARLDRVTVTACAQHQQAARPVHTRLRALVRQMQVAHRYDLPTVTTAHEEELLDEIAVLPPLTRVVLLQQVVDAMACDNRIFEAIVTMEAHEHERTRIPQ
jgi:hypothetical protein